MNMAQPASPFSVGSLAQLTLSLLVIVGLIFALSWLLKRFRIAGSRSRGEIVILDGLAVGPRDRIVLFAVGRSQVLVGVGASGMVALTPLAEPIVLQQASTPAPAFADKLRDLTKRPGGSA
jgi:flagellar protein FliO/FliZ